MFKEALSIGTVVGKLVDDAINKDQRELLDDAMEKAEADCEKFKTDLLSGNMVGAQLALDGLRYGIKVNITEAEYSRLKSKAISTVDAYDLLGLYCIGRSAEYIAQAAEIKTTTKV